MGVQTSDGVRFGEFLLDRSAGGLFRLNERGERVPVPLGSRALDVLCALVERSGELVSKQAIMDAVWPDTAVEESNLTVQVSALRRVLDEGRTQGSIIQTVAGRGYRLVEPVRHNDENPAPQRNHGQRQDASDGNQAASAEPAPSRWDTVRSSWHHGSGLVVLAMTGLALVALLVFANSRSFWIRPQSDPPRLSIVVLPFDNLSGDPRDDYLVEGITDDLTTDLSHMPQATVIAHASARAVKSRKLDIHQIGQDLGVRYVIEGSVRRVGTALRINIQLVSTETGTHLWAERLDREQVDLLVGQDAILAPIRGALGLSLIDVEVARGRRERPANPDSLDLILRARWWTNQPPNQDRMRQARTLYEQALRLDPSSVPAMTGLANVLSEQNMNWAGQWLSAEAEQLAEKLVTDALALAPSSEEALVAQVRFLQGRTRFKELLEPSQRLVALYPNNPEGYHHLAWAMQFDGRFDDAVALFDKAIQLDPLEPRVFNRYGFKGFSLMQAGHYNDSAAAFARSLAANPNAPPQLLARRYRNMSASLALAGRLEEAHQAAREAERLWPFDTVRSTWPLDIRSPALVAHELVFQRGLRLAGVRDHADENADRGIEPDNVLHAALSGYTPLMMPGARTIRTEELAGMLEADTPPILLDPGTHYWARSLPGAVAVSKAGLGGSLADQIQDRLRTLMAKLSDGRFDRAVVALGWNSESFDGYNLALRLVALGYTQVYWYRGGREAWEVTGLPETELKLEPW